MAKRERRTFSEEFKQQLMNELSSGRKLIKVAAEHNIQPSQISQWKKKMGDSTRRKSKASSDSAATAKQKASQKMGGAPKRVQGRSLNGSSSTIEELERVIGQLTVENARLRRQLEGR